MKQIELTKGCVALVDDEDFESLNAHRWYVNNSGYAVRIVIHVGGKRSAELMHRRVLGLSLRDGKEGDHVNGLKLDNQRGNLRVCVHAENLRNKPLTRMNKSGVKGVSWDKSENRWRATIKVNGKQHHLGRFLTIDEARDAYNRAAPQLHGEFANTGEQQ